MADYILSVKITGDSKDLEKKAKSASSVFESFGQKLKSVSNGFFMGAGMKAFEVGMSSISSHMDSAISRFDTLNNFPKVMENLGIDAGKADASINTLKERLKGLPTTLDSAASGVQRLTACNGDVSKSTDYFLALNDAIVAGGQSTDVQNSAIEQLSQAYSKGKMEMEEWRSLQMAMPGQLNQIAKAMGMSTDELGEGLRDGSISMDEFMDTIVKLDKEGVDGFKSFSDQALDATGGIGTALANLNTAITSGITESMKAIDEALQANNLPTIGEMINMVGSKISDLGKKAAELIPKLVTVGVFVKEHSSTFKVLGAAVLGVVGAFKMMSLVNTVASGVKLLSANMLSLAGRAAATVPALGAEAAASTAAGTASRVSASGFMKAGAGLLMMGAGLALAAVGMALFVQSAIALAQSGGLAIAVIAGMVLAVAGLIVLVTMLGPAFLVGAAAMVLFGAGMMLVAAAIRVAAGAIPAINSLLRTLAMVFATTCASINSVISTLSRGFSSFARSVSTVMNSVGGIIESIGSSISGVLDSVAGIFDSIGNAALNAGRGVYYIAAGLRMLSTIKLSTLVSHLGVAAKGLSKIGKSGEELTAAATGITTLANGFAKLQTTSTGSAAAMKSIKSSATSTSSALTKIGSTLTTVSSKFRSVGTAGASGFSRMGSTISRTISSARSKLNSFIKETNKLKNIQGKVTIKAKLPHFSVSWSTQTRGKTSVSIPSVRQWATGAIFSGPSLLAGGNLVGEAGPEAVAPISTLQRYVADAVSTGMKGGDEYSTFNVVMNISGADDPREWGESFVKTLQRTARMGV